jgi:catechol 2,3-dioxygenase
MTPKLAGVDHLHVQVGSWKEAEKWYSEALNLTRVEALMPWAVRNGPLTIENPESTVHLALFESEKPKPTNVIALGALGEEFLGWIKHLESLGLKLRVVDHKLAFSMYFRDPWKNNHEITTYDHEFVREQLASDSDEPSDTAVL